ncbi:MAG: QueT transporter family protein [Oscillospiraceae bacterium]|nr:QueT transporter family protein [Oscillospiraceae bacterium]
MKRNATRYISHAAMLAALYVVLTHLQNLIFPDSATWAIQFRASEALCIFSLFTPAAIPGLTIGCMLFNLSYAGTLPLDILLGTLATVLATLAMWLTRKITIKGYPAVAMLMPALFNAILVGWELTVYIGEAFWFNAICVAAGEAAVLLTLGTALFYAMKARNLDRRFFGA